MSAKLWDLATYTCIRTFKVCHRYGIFLISDFVNYLSHMRLVVILFCIFNYTHPNSLVIVKIIIIIIIIIFIIIIISIIVVVVIIITVIQYEI